MLAAAAPALFVLLWSTGFIGAKLGLPYAEPFTFLALRYALVSGVLLVVMVVAGSPWLRSPADLLHTVVAGLLLHGVYLGGVFTSLHLGLEAGVSALIVGVQPLLTAALAVPLLRERVNRAQVAGLLLGLGGVALVAWQKAHLGTGPSWGVGLSVLALVGITLGTLYQKRYCGEISLVSGNLVQFGFTGIAMGLLALAFESRKVVWSGEFVFALGWLVLVLSLGAISLLYVLIRNGAAARVASLFYLVPPVTALLAWQLFDERLGTPALVGMVMAVAGVALVNFSERANALFRR
ncbi:MAG TPA: DMT family transporter [Gammaproteobacteria bacterium]|nr:DMT family transporter [Gammaproteobacteria bacterium]